MLRSVNFWRGRSGFQVFFEILRFHDLDISFRVEDVYEVRTRSVGD